MILIVSFGFFLCGALLSMAILGFVLAVVIPLVDRWSKNFFIILFFILMLCMGSFLVDMIVCTNPDLLSVEKASWFFESLFISIPMVMFTVYLLHCCGESPKSSALLRAAILIWTVYVIQLILSQCTLWYFYILPGPPINQFAAGPAYPLLIVCLILIIILNLQGVIRRRNRLTRRNLCAFLFFLLPLITAMVIHVFNINFLVVDIAITTSVLSMFFTILSNQREQQMRQQQELVRQQASIMVLQMRPHFICNTMMSIYYLCVQDPEKAQKVTMDFTNYLRRNFTAIASNNTIPFSDELEHTRAYLTVEQAGLEDRLIIEYDTPHTHFRVPPLTLQPIVENAIKHGMDPDSDPLMIRIRTRETEAGSEIIVEDNGIGFAPADDSELHVALANIRQRLKLMCGGKMIITSREGGGTKVRVIIP